MSYLDKESSIIDLGGGTGKLTNYLIKNNYEAICYDFSEKMRDNALKLSPNIPYTLDNIINVGNHFNNDSIDCFISMYSLFRISRENIEKLFSDISNILKKNGLFCFSIQLGDGEEYVDKPYLGDKVKKILYMNYYSKDEIYESLEKSGFKVIYEEEKNESLDNAVGNYDNTILIIARKES